MRCPHHCARLMTDVLPKCWLTACIPDASLSTPFVPQLSAASFEGIPRVAGHKCALCAAGFLRRAWLRCMRSWQSMIGKLPQRWAKPSSARSTKPPLLAVSAILGHMSPLKVILSCIEWCSDVAVRASQATKHCIWLIGSKGLHSSRSGAELSVIIQLRAVHDI